MQKLQNLSTTRENGTYNQIIRNSKSTELIDELNRNEMVVSALEKYQNSKKRNLWISVIVIAITIALFIIGIINFGNHTTTSFVLFGVGAALTIFWFYYLFTTRKNLFNTILEVLNNCVNVEELWKSYFEGKYSNIKFLGKTSENLLAIFAIRKPKEVPNDARISNDFGGYAFKLNDLTIESRRIEWKWVRRDSRGNYINHFYQAVYFGSYDLNQRWRGFRYTMDFKGIFNKGKELENEAFNKMFSYTHNDPIRLRVLLTPLIQELCVQEFPNTFLSNSFEFDVDGDGYIMIKSSKGKTPFTVDLKYGATVKDVIDEMVNDLESDMLFVEECLGMLATFRELTK